MFKWKKWFLVFLLFNFGCILEVHAASINAASCSQSDVQSAINSARDYDIVMVPAGSCTWTSVVTINKEITLRGAGVNLTNIINGQSLRYKGVLKVTAASRITMITFKGKPGTNNKDHIIDITGSFSGFRIDNCNFEDGNNISVSIFVSNAYGVIDHCNFTDAALEIIQVLGRGSTSWSTASSLGTADAVYMEDNIFFDSAPSGYTGATHAVLGENGARYVFRYNNITNANIDAHGYCGNSGGGTRHYEIYGNRNTVGSGINQARWMNIRGGSGVIYNNIMTVNGSLSSRIALTEHRIDRSTCKGGCSCSYPSKDQIGRGTNQESEPLYIWNNNIDGKAATGLTSDYANPGDCEAICGKTQNINDYVQVNRDYYNDIDLQDRGDYTPYAYPHPLTTGNFKVPKKPTRTQGQQVL